MHGPSPNWFGVLATLRLNLILRVQSLGAVIFIIENKKSTVQVLIITTKNTMTFPGVHQNMKLREFICASQSNSVILSQRSALRRPRSLS